MMRRLATTSHEKVWGSTALEPWYPNPPQKTGEVWFETVEGLPLLVKFIFTSERLSIQVHPDDAAAKQMGEPRGKTEMWYILRAEPGAKLGVGLRERISRDRLREACASGEIEALMNWIPVAPGDVVFVPAGAIHAIGAGLAVCEIQQLSDVTYRLYDYGRPRELHLEHGIAVADAGPHPGKSTLPVASPYFVTTELRAEQPLTLSPQRQEILIVTNGSGSLSSERYRQGEAWLVSAEAAVRIAPDAPSHFLRTHLP